MDLEVQKVRKNLRGHRTLEVFTVGAEKDEASGHLKQKVLRMIADSENKDETVI